MSSVDRTNSQPESQPQHIYQGQSGNIYKIPSPFSHGVKSSGAAGTMVQLFPGLVKFKPGKGKDNDKEDRRLPLISIRRDGGLSDTGLPRRILFVPDDLDPTSDLSYLGERVVCLQ